MTPTPEERRIREDVEFDSTAHGDDIRELLAEYDQLHTSLIARDVALRHAVEENERLRDEADHWHNLREKLHTGIRATIGRRPPDQRGEDADDDLIADVANLHAALTELRAASRGLAFFDQIKCAQWNTAYQQASQILGLEDET